jgi:hypothetical protein
MLLTGAFGVRKGSGVAMPVSSAFLGVGIYWFARRPFERRWMVRRRFRKRPDRDMEVA